VSLVRGGPLLGNDVTILLIEKEHRPKDADWFVEWMMSYRGLDAIDNYRVEGRKAFYTQRWRQSSGQPRLCILAAVALVRLSGLLRVLL
jgi:ABC-type tungstate transport system permease subunit